MLHVDIKKSISSFLAHERTLFPAHLPQQLKELYLANAISTFAISAAFLFEPIYLYSIGFTLWQIMLFYVGVYGAYFILMPLGGKIVKRNGFEHGMMYGSFFLILYFVFLLAIQTSEAFVIPAMFTLALYKTVFWPGYHADFAFFGQSQERGREIGNLAILDSIMNVLGPVIGGLLVNFFGFPIFFAFMCIVIIVSNIPFLLTKEIFKPSDFSYRGAYETLFAKENRKYFFGYIGFGEELVALTIWPIFLFITFGNVVSTGLLVAFSTFITALVLLYVGRATDMKDRRYVLRIGALLNSFVWCMRLVVRSASPVAFVDILSRASKNIFILPMLSGLYEHARKTSVVQTVIFFEMSLTVGKLLTGSILAVLFFFMPDGWHAAFFVAFLFSLLFFVIAGNRAKSHPSVE